MKSGGQTQQKRKVKQIPKENNEQTGGVHKKSAGRIRMPLQEAAVFDQGKPVMEMASGDKFKIKARDFHLSEKIKLQLFPVNETVRLTLEKDGHYPFLELTLSARKKISSIINHLNSKWGNFRAGPGELVLLPYDRQWAKVTSCRWTSCTTAGELYALLEFPAVFRLRYGWFSSLSVEASGRPSTTVPSEDISGPQNCATAGNLFSLITGDYAEKMVLTTQEIKNPSYVHDAADVNVSEQRPSDVPAGNVGDNLMADGVPTTSPVSWEDCFTNLSIGGLLSEASLLDKINKSEKSKPVLSSDISIGALLSETIFNDKMNGSKLKSENEMGLHTTESFTGKSTEGLNFGATFQDMNSHYLQTAHEVGFQGITLASGNSTGDMFSNSSFDVKTNIHSTTPSVGKSRLHPSTDSVAVLSAWDDVLTTLSIGGLLSEASLLDRIYPKSKGSSSNSKNQISNLDSLDVFISGENNSDPQHKSSLLNSSSSIFDAEVACNEFDFQKVTPSGGDVNSVNRRDLYEGIDKKNLMNSLPHHDEESNLGIKGINWNDSRGPFDLGLPMSHPVSGVERVGRFFNSFSSRS